jgi:hypothetical protein
MAKQKAKGQEPLSAAHQSFLSGVPDDHRATVAAALDAAPAAQRGPIIDAIKTLRGLNIPWGKLVALIPVIAAFLANPATGIVALITAIAALFQPAA